MLPVLLTSEFSLKSLGLNHEEPNDFLVSKWQKKMGGISRWYVLYRWFWAVYHACWCAICFLDEGGLDSPISRKVFYFIYLTQWSYMILTTMNITWAIIVTKAHSESKAKHFLVKPTMTRKLKALWVLVNLSFLPAVLITTVYWLAIYDPNYPISATNVETHILNTVYVLIDLTVSAVPLRILHFYQPMFYLLVYLTFNLIYFLSGGLTPLGNHAIYPIMDWENLPLTIPFMLLTLLLIIVTQTIVWSISLASSLLVKAVLPPKILPNAAQDLPATDDRRPADPTVHV